MPPLHTRATDMLQYGQIKGAEDTVVIKARSPHYAANMYIKDKTPAWPLRYAQHDLHMLRSYLDLQPTHFGTGNNTKQGLFYTSTTM